MKLASFSPNAWNPYYVIGYHLVIDIKFGAYGWYKAENVWCQAIRRVKE